MLLPVSILTADPKIHTQKNGIAVKYSILKNFSSSYTRENNCHNMSYK